MLQYRDLHLRSFPDFSFESSFQKRRIRILEGVLSSRAQETFNPDLDLDRMLKCSVILTSYGISHWSSLRQRSRRKRGYWEIVIVRVYDPSGGSRAIPVCCGGYSHNNNPNRRTGTNVAYRSGWSLHMDGFFDPVVKIELYPKMVQMNTGMYLAYIDDILRVFVLLSEVEIAFNMACELLNIENQVLTTPLGSISPNGTLISWKANINRYRHNSTRNWHAQERIVTI